MGLSGQQRKKLQDALLDAFPEKASLEQMLAFELNQNLDEIAGGSNLKDIVFILIRQAKSQGWIEDLVRAARKSNPGNESLRNIAEELLSVSRGIPFKQQQKNRRDLLEQVNSEVTGRLESSLHNAIWINLRKESQPQKIKRSWERRVKIGSKPDESLANSTTILEVFDREVIAGRLLILGNPGAGKTTTMLDLAQSLVTRAKEQPDYPIPVLLDLSDWKDERQKFIEWLVIELKSKYDVREQVGQDWLQNRQLLPLLDGLDEVKPIFQESCIHSINQFLLESKPHHVVVCSRSEEYSNLSTKLLLNGAIDLQPLNNNQIDDYLNEVNYQELRQTINNDSSLLELVRTPLLLNVSIFAFQEISIEHWQHLSSNTERIEYLLDAYVTRMLNRDISISKDRITITSQTYGKKKTPNDRQTRLWLVWLAKQLKGQGKTEFLIEKMQPYWLINSSERRNYILIYGLIYGLIHWFLLGFFIFGLPSSLLFGRPLREALSHGFRIASIGGCIAFIGGLMNGQTLEILLRENFIYNRIKKEKIFDIFSHGLIGGLVLLFTGFIYQIFFIIGFLSVPISREMMTFFLASGVIFGLFVGLAKAEPESDIKTKKTPNQGIWKSAIAGVITGIFNALILGLIGGLISKRIDSIIVGAIAGFLAGLGMGGGYTCLQHLSLRLILYQNGYIPWNYARFLDYCTERSFLQRVGGRYRFIHKMVQEHFANMDFNTD